MDYQHIEIVDDHTIRRIGDGFIAIKEAIVFAMLTEGDVKFYAGVDEFPTVMNSRDFTKTLQGLNRFSMTPGSVVMNEVTYVPGDIIPAQNITQQTDSCDVMPLGICKSASEDIAGYKASPTSSSIHADQGSAHTPSQYPASLEMVTEVSMVPIPHPADHPERWQSDAAPQMKAFVFDSGGFFIVAQNRESAELALVKYFADGISEGRMKSVLTSCEEFSIPCRLVQVSAGVLPERKMQQF